MSKENKPKKASPFDFFKKSTKYSSDEEARERYSICVECPHFMSATSQCRKCGCFMNLKVRLKHAECPVGNW